MLSTSGDLLIMVLVAMVAATMAVAVSHLVSLRRSRIPRLRLLTGTHSQQAAIMLAVRPVVRELLPALEAAGLEVSSIALLPTLAGSAGEPLQAQVEQVNGSAFVIRLAHMVGGILRRPEEVAGALAGELLGLYRDAAAVKIVRQTPAATPERILVAAENVAVRKNGHSGVSPQSRAAAKDEAEGKIIQFKDPLGSTNGQGA